MSCQSKFREKARTPLCLAAQVSPAEVAGAVVDLLRTAGMPLDLERQQLLEQSLAMQRQIEDARDQLAQQAQVSISPSPGITKWLLPQGASYDSGNLSCTLKCRS